jgi:hypothetical protein
MPECEEEQAYKRGKSNEHGPQKIFDDCHSRPRVVCNERLGRQSVLKEIVGWRFANQTGAANRAPICPNRRVCMLLIREHVYKLHWAVTCQTSRRQMVDVRRHPNLQTEALPLANGIMS